MKYLSYSLFILSITLSVLAQAPVPNNIDLDQRCCFQFNDPQLPSFILPAPQLNSPGDIQLNVNNSITLYNGHAISQGCNGDRTFYKVNGTWVETYVDANGENRTGIDLFYATATDHLNFRTIQTWQRNIAEVLNDRLIAVIITCNNGVTSCLKFTVNGTIVDDLAGDAPGYCGGAGSLFSSISIVILICSALLTLF